MLIPWRVCRCFCSDQCKIVAKKSKKHTLHLGTPENSEGSLVKVFGPKILGVFGLLPSGSHHQKKRGKAEHLCEKKPPVSYGHFCFFWGKNGSFRGFGLFFLFFPPLRRSKILLPSKKNIHRRWGGHHFNFKLSDVFCFQTADFCLGGFCFCTP